MKTKREQKFSYYPSQNGNALIYVLIAIVLFAALSFSLSRQSRYGGGTGEIDAAKAEFHAAQMIAYASQVKSAIDQMIVTGSTIDDLDFILPSDANFDTGSPVHKVYHPAGGGITHANLPDNAVNQISTTPEAGWYMGAFNNVEWTKTTGTEIILTAYQIAMPVCEKINQKITGQTTIPVLAGDVRIFLLDDTIFGGSNDDLEAADCAACEGYPSLCVSNAAATQFSFYSITAER